MKNKEAEIHFTRYCSYNCVFCSVKKHSNPNLSTNNIKKDIKLSKDFSRLIISGGEPSIRKDIINLISYAKKFNNNLSMETNASCLSEKLISKMIKAGLKEFKISFHSYNKDAYNKITKTKGYYDKVIKNLNILKKYSSNVKISTNTVITKYNQKELYKTINFLMNKFPFIFKIRVSYPRFYPIKEYEEYSKKHLVSLEKIKNELKSIDKINDTRIIFENIPLCIVSSKKAQNINWNIYLIKKGKITRGLEGRYFEKKCGLCKKRKKCQGLHKYYPLYFKIDFLKPFVK